MYVPNYMKTGDRVLPVRSVLDDMGCIWEWRLAESGWNGLSEDDKVGVITRDDPTYVMLLVTFPNCNLEVGVFPDEIKPA